MSRPSREKIACYRFVHPDGCVQHECRCDGPKPNYPVAELCPKHSLPDGDI